MNWRFKWKAEEVKKLVQSAGGDILADFALEAEGAAKDELYPGHGKDTGTLERSIHVAEPGYNWGADDVPASLGTPERGGRRVRPVVSGSRQSLSLGSGVRYAMAQHQGFRHYLSGKFIKGYHYIVQGVEKTRGRLSSIVKRHNL